MFIIKKEKSGDTGKVEEKIAEKEESEEKIKKRERVKKS
jgi:hypothetical protein